MPQFIKDEFDAFLECGILGHGFLRLRCGACGHDKLLVGEMLILDGGVVTPPAMGVSRSGADTLLRSSFDERPHQGRFVQRHDNAENTPCHGSELLFS